MKNQILKFFLFSILSIVAINCQSPKLSYKADIKIDEEMFALNTEATFRPFVELLSVPKPIAYNVPIEESVYEYLPDWNRLKKVSGGTALTRNHTLVTWEWKKIYNNAERAYITKDSRLAMFVIDTLYQAAVNDTLLDTISARNAYPQGCWGGGANSVCPFHHSQTASEFFINSAHSAILIRSWLLTKPTMKSQIDSWLDKGFNKFVKGVADLNGTGPNGGLYEYMNGKSGVLIYAIYNNDPELFLKYAKKGIAQINQHLDDNGYIYSNSWRGVRSLWYHSLGVDAILGFGELLETQGIVFYNQPLLKEKLRKSYFEALKGSDDPYQFESKGYRGTNYITDNSKARRGLHQAAAALQWIGAWRFPDVGQKYLPLYWFDSVIGMNPQHIYADRIKILEQHIWQKQE